MWTTGGARRASLHPWLQTCAPDGAESRNGGRRVKYWWDGWPVKLAREGMVEIHADAGATGRCPERSVFVFNRDL